MGSLSDSSVCRLCANSPEDEKEDEAAMDRETQVERKCIFQDPDLIVKISFFLPIQVS